MSERRLTLADLVPGRTYRSPGGRLCLLTSAPRRDATALQFAYLTKRGLRSTKEGFWLSTDNAATIAALREVGP